MLIDAEPVPFKPLAPKEPKAPTDPIEEADGYTFLEKAEAAFQREHTIGSMLANNVIQSSYDPTYNPWDEFTQAEKVTRSFVEDAMYANSTEALESIRAQKRKEKKNAEMLTGWDGIALSMGAAIVDPINFIPVAGAAYKTYRTGGNILKGAAVVSAATAGVVTAQEALLQSQQLERSYGESAINITASAFLGGVLGGGAIALRGRKLNKLAQEIENIVPSQPDLSVGAKQVDGTFEVKGLAARMLAKTLKWDPIARVLSQDSKTAKEFLSELVENPYDIEGTMDAPAAESRIKSSLDAYVYRGVTGGEKIYHGYLEDIGTGKYKAKFDSKVMPYRDFKELVSKEIRNPSPDANPRVKEAAKHWVDTVYDPIKKDLIELKMLDEGVEVKTAAGYLNRVWSKERLAGNYAKFIKVAEDWLIKEGLPKTATPDDLQDPAFLVAERIAGNIMGSPNSMLPIDFKLPESVKGPLKARVFDIPDELIEEFLENDIEAVATRYARQMVPDIELVRRFGDGETPVSKVLDFEPQIRAINEDYADLMANAKTGKAGDKIRKKHNKTVNDLMAMRDRMRGTYGQPDPDSMFHRIGSGARNLNFMRMMGGVTVSSFPDFARLIMSEGMIKAFGGAFRHLSKWLEGSNLAAEDVRWWGIGTDAFMAGRGGRLQAISDINDYVLGNSSLERGLQYGADKMSQINLMNRWTGAMKQIHAVSMQAEVMDTLLKGKFDHRLQRLGIDSQDAMAIRDQVLKHGSRDGKAWVYNAKAWEDQGLAQRWYSAMKKESDRVIVNVGQEKPLFMSTELGKTLFQFKSFMMSATSRVMIAGIQGQDAHMIQGSLAMISMGAMTYVVKNKEAGREIDYSPQALIAEGIDRSGALGIFMEMNNTVEKVMGLGLRPMLGVDAPASRFASRSVKESLMGPTFGSLADAVLRGAEMAGMALDSDREFTKSDLRAVRRVVPFQNLTLLRIGLDKIEEKLADSLNLE